MSVTPSIRVTLWGILLFALMVAGAAFSYLTVDRLVGNHMSVGHVIGARSWIVSAGIAEFLIVGAFGYMVATHLAHSRRLISRLALSSAADSADDAIFTMDMRGIITSWSHGAELMYGYAAKEIIGKPDAVLCLPSDVHELQTLVETVRQGKRLQRYETTRVAKDGTLLLVARNAWPAYNDQGEVIGACVMSRDIAAQKKAEEALRRSEEQYRVLFASHPLPMWVADCPTLRFLAVNEATLRHYGYSRDEFLKMSLPDIRLEDAAPESLPGDGSLDCLVSAQLVQHRKKDGTVVDIEIARHPVEFAGQAAILMLAHDVTEQRRAKARLLSSEHKFAKAFHLSPLGGTITTRAEGRYVDANETFLKMLGYSRDEVVGKTVFDLKLWRTKGDRAQMLENMDMEGKGQSAFLETVFATSSGSSRSVQVFAEPLELDGVPCILAITHDVTERKHLETQLRQAQKMEAVGRLAGGVAHDFNNMLGVIGGYTELLQSRMLDGDAQKQIKEIRRAVERAASLTRQLLAFSRKQVLQPKVLDLNEKIRELSTMLLRLIGDDIELVIRSGDSLALVEADPGQIDQVILNLVVNARDAMPKGGKIVLETANTRLDKNASLQRGPVKPGNYVLLAVSDTGFGMDAETLSYIFEPFFTTKEQGKGTGLGLSTVHGIVIQSQGYVWVASQPGGGSVFKIYLPVAGQALPAMEEESDRRPIAFGAGTILLVEDEEQMRALTKQVLEAHGYQVLEASNGAAAIELAKEHAEIHLLLTDVVMPRLSGPGLAEQIRELHPQIGVVYMSGYTDELLTRHGSLAKQDGFLEKPFTQENLVCTVQKGLGKSKEKQDSSSEEVIGVPQGF